MSSGDGILWRCRRGTKELDLMLERFARECYPRASPERRQAFERLLSLPDPHIVELLLGSGRSEDPGLAEVAMLVAGSDRG